MNRASVVCLHRKGFDMNVIDIKQHTSRILSDFPDGYVRINQIPTTPLHNHLFCEIHIIVEGEAIFTINAKEYRVPANHAVLIPPHHYHAIRAGSDRISRISFYTEHHENRVICKQFSGEFITETHQKIKEKADISVVYNHLLFILNELLPANDVRVFPLNDYKLQIREFFSLNYAKKITLHDLASELHLSDMQTQRVIKKHTGKTFGENLLAQRMTVAENLMKNTEMSLSEIAEYIGYHSYCGFWKAYKKHQESDVADERSLKRKSPS